MARSHHQVLLRKMRTNAHAPTALNGEPRYDIPTECQCLFSKQKPFIVVILFDFFNIQERQSLHKEPGKWTSQAEHHHTVAEPVCHLSKEQAWPINLSWAYWDHSWKKGFCLIKPDLRIFWKNFPDKISLNFGWTGSHFFPAMVGAKVDS